MYSFDGRVRYSECDGDGRLSLVSMMNYLQDCSTFHSEATGVGLGWLGEQGLGWIVMSSITTSAHNTKLLVWNA